MNNATGKRISEPFALVFIALCFHPL